jgi:deoxyribodipyrimidine photo-lyase
MSAEGQTGRPGGGPVSAPDFPAHDDAWQARVDALDPAAYARTRNHLGGAVSRLSPYITHGYVSLPQIHERLARRIGRPLNPQDKLFAEFGWREFFLHVWRHAGERILQDLRPGLPGVAYSAVLPDDLREARTGVPVIDQAVRVLYQTGYLHNHARLWLASYLVHLRKVHWRVGADWMLAHLLDGDLASNHLSWQWVAGTFSAKPYLFNAENVARWAPAPWHSPGTPIDRSYEQIEAIARSPRAVSASAGSRPRLFESVQEPPVTACPPSTLFDLQCAAQADALDALAWPDPGERSVEWVHPWSMSPRTDAGLRIGVLHAAYHRRFPWSLQRWRFVIARMQAVCDTLVWLDPAQAEGLQGWRARIAERGGVMRATQAPGYLDLAGWPGLRVQAAARLLPDPDRPCRSFSAFYKAATARRTSTPIR